MLKYCRRSKRYWEIPITLWSSKFDMILLKVSDVMYMDSCVLPFSLSYKLNADVLLFDVHMLCLFVFAFTFDLYKTISTCVKTFSGADLYQESGLFSILHITAIVHAFIRFVIYIYSC